LGKKFNYFPCHNFVAFVPIPSFKGIFESRSPAVPTHRGGTVKLTVVLYEEVVTVDHPRQEQSFTKADRFLATPSHRETDMRKTAYRPNRLYHRVFAKVISHGTAPI